MVRLTPRPATNREGVEWLYILILQSRRMRYRRDERGIHFVDGELLCHGYVSSAVEVDWAISDAGVAPQLGTQQT